MNCHFLVVALLLTTSLSSMNTPCTGSASASSASATHAPYTDTVTPTALQPYGIMCVQGFSPIINIGDTLPRSRTCNYRTVYNNQTRILVQIHETEDTKLRDFMISGIPPRPAGRETINVNFDVNHSGSLHVTATIVSTGKSECLTIVSSGLNSTRPQRIESQIKTLRTLKPADIGAWFWELNRDITTRNESVACFEHNPAVYRLVNILNQVVEKTMDKSRYTNAFGVVDTTARDNAFHTLVNDTVLRIRPSLIQANLKHGLQQAHFKAFFKSNIPTLISHLNTLLEQARDSDWDVVSDPQSDVPSAPSHHQRRNDIIPRPTSAPHRQVVVTRGSHQPTIRHRTTGHGTLFIEHMSPQYFVQATGKYGDPVAYAIGQQLSYFARHNGRYYQNMTWSQSEYDTDRMTLLDLVRNLIGAQSRRGTGESPSEISEILQVLREIRTHESDHSYDNVIHLMTDQFG